ncbi:MAG TPA: GNAT family N-acyltransferase [Pyrinomonadaceae bacterium]
MNAALSYLPSVDTANEVLLVSDGRYVARLANSADEIEAALRLRHRVFNVELGGHPEIDDLEQDAFDLVCRHLIVVDRVTGQIVGTYRLNSVESAVDTKGFYSFGEFSIEDLPADVLARGVEVGRACISAAHRNTKVLYLLWRALARFLQIYNKRYMFGCCSIFSRDPLVGERAFHQLAKAGHFHDRLRVEPRRNALYLGPVEEIEREPVELPSLFNMFLRIGAKVCGPPIIDDDFGTIDFFVVFDREAMTEKCRKTFFDDIG